VYIIFLSEYLQMYHQSQGIPLGITVTQGNAPYMMWAAFALLLASIIPYAARYVVLLFGCVLTSALPPNQAVALSEDDKSM
jgi:hypothetical protein